MTSSTSARRALAPLDTKGELDTARAEWYGGDYESSSVNELKRNQSGELQSRDRDTEGRALFRSRFSEDQSVSGGGEDDDDEEDVKEEFELDDEKHRLINSGRHTANKNTTIGRDYSSYKTDDIAHAGKNPYHEDEAGLLHTVAKYFKFTPNSMTSTSIRTASGSSHRNYRTSNHNVTPHPIGAFVCSVLPDAVTTASPNDPGRHRKGSGWHCSRLILINSLLVLLIISSFLLLCKLISLVQDERVRIDSMGEHSQRDFEHKQRDEAHRKQLEIDKLSRWLVATPKCHIPMLDPWHESIRDYVHVNSAMNCSKVVEESLAKTGESNKKHYGQARETRTMTFVRDNRLYFSPDAMIRGALTGSCCFKYLNRTLNADDSLEQADQCTIISSNGLMMNHSLIELTCLHPFNYTNVHSFIVHDEEEEGALGRVAQIKSDLNQYYNVLLVGVDTMSRLNAQRQLRRTLKVLNERYRTLDFVGYNKVGENTFPNLVPLLTGLKPEQLVDTQCWMAKNYTQENERGDDYLDNCKFLWNYYQQIGYTTYFSEDWPSASTFNYLKPGFRSEPTTYYGRPFTLARDSLTYPTFESIGCASCQLDKPIVQIDLDNLLSFIKYHRHRPYFAFHWLNCPQHDDLNGGSRFDHILEDFFNHLLDVTQDNRTFVIFFSDHGWRWNDFVSTRIGHYESSLPLLTIAPPKLFIEQHPDLFERMKRHQNTLLTPFDIFKTLIDLKNLSSANGSRTAPRAINKRVARQSIGDFFFGAPQAYVNTGIWGQWSDPLTPTVYPTAFTTISEIKMEDGTTYKQNFKTLSLFDEHTQEDLDRSCVEAGIPDNYCVCHQYQPIKEDRLDALGAVYYLVYRHLADRLRNHLDICRALDLDKVHKAEVFSFEQMQKTAASNLIDVNLTRRRRQATENSTVVLLPQSDRKVISSSLPNVGTFTDGSNLASEDGSHLPNREYSIMFATKPGGGLFQEVVRFYGGDMKKCELEISKARKIVEDPWAQYGEKLATVKVMNSVCRFSVHSDSISRFNLYKNQSKCVKSNIELKKICYCNNLI